MMRDDAIAGNDSIAGGDAVAGDGAEVRNQDAQLRDQIERAKQEWEITVDSLPQLVCLLDDGGLVLRANRCVENWGLSPVTEVEGLALHNLLHKDCPDPGCYFQTSWHQAWQEVTAGRAAEFEVEDRPLDRWLRFQVRPVSTETHRRDKVAGRFAAVIVVEDITQHRIMSLALGDAQAQIRTLFESTPLGIGLTTLEGDILAANQAMLRTTGYSETEMMQLNVSELYQDPEQRAVVLERLQASDAVRNFGVKLLRKDGTPYNASLNVSRLTRSDRDVLLAVIEDVTEQVEATEQAAVAAERNRIAGDLHDSVTQALYTASIIAESLPGVWERHPEEARRTLAELRSLTQGALAEMRTMLLELHPDALAGRTLGELLRQLTDAMSARTSLPITTTVSGAYPIPSEAKVAFYRIAQEALNNISKHARANRAWLNVHYHPDGATLRIGDDGRGFDPEAAQPHRLGLSIIRERAQAIGATLTIKSQPDQGTEITVEWHASLE
jgi:PAS domain S-box-containing protein